MIDLLLFLLLGSFTGLLAGMFGIGGGSILVPALIFMFYRMGFDSSIVVYLAIGTSLASIFFSALSSAYSHHLKQSVEWRLVMPLSAGMVLGALLGAKYATSLSGDNLKVIITLFLLGIGSDMVLNYSKLLMDPTKKIVIVSRLTAPLHGTWIGGLSAIIGIGGGSFTTPLLIAGGYNIRKGIGTAAACGAPIALAGAVGYMYFGKDRLGLPHMTSGFIFWPAVLGIACASIITAKVGASISHSIPERTLKILFGVFLMLVGIMVAVN